MLEVSEAEAERLDLREMRYDRIDVTADVRALAGGQPPPDFELVVLYAAKARQHAPRAPAGAIVIAEYARTVESAFAELGAEQLDLYHRTTDPPPVAPVEATLVYGRIPEGSPRRPAAV